MTQELLDKLRKLPQEQQDEIISTIKEYYEAYETKKHKLIKEFDQLMSKMSDVGIVIGYEGEVFDPIDALVFLTEEEGIKFYEV